MAHHENLSVPSQPPPSTTQHPTQPNLTINSTMTTTMLPDASPLPLPKPTPFLAPLAATSTTSLPPHPATITNPSNVTFPIHDPNTLSHQPSTQDPFLTTTTTQPKWRVTPAQKEILMKAFDEDAYPELQKKVQLAETLGVTTTQISKWFQHRRESLSRTGQFKAQYNRTRRTPEELDVLQAAFEVDRYPTAERLAELEAQLTGVTAKQIKLWFKHRRKQVQKRNRITTSISIPTLPTNPNTPYTTTPTIGINQNVVKMMRRPDGTPSVTDLQRNDWRSNDSNPTGMVNTNPQLSTQQLQSVYNNNTNPSFSYMPNLYQYSSSCKVNNALPQNIQFSEMELMALRGANAVSNANPSTEGVVRLAQLLNRPQNVLSEWFRSQESIRPLEGSTTDTPQPSVLYSDIDPKLNTTSRATDLQTQSLSQKDEKSTIDVELNPKNREKETVQASSTSDAQPDTNGIVNSLNAQPTSAQTSANRSGSIDPSQGSVMTHPQAAAGMYQTYLYQNTVDGRVIVPQQTQPFQQVQPGSTPVLAPLRYTPSSSAAPNYVPQNGVWYQSTTPYSNSK